MLRSHNCEELRLNDAGNTVTLCGWVQRRRDFGGMSFIDLRDRYGITQLSFNEDYNVELLNEARSVSREFVVKITGEVTERKQQKPQSGHWRYRDCCQYTGSFKPLFNTPIYH